MGLYPLQQGKGHSGGPRARLSGGLAGKLLDEHYGHRPLAVRLTLRAFSESRTYLNARHRRRLLYARPRRSDSLCDGEVRARSSGADHHLRHLGGQGFRKRRGPRARPQLRRGREGDQAGAVAADWHQAGGRDQDGAAVR